MTASRGIIGVGNVLLGDEGVGVHVVRALLERPLPDDLLVFDGGTEGLGLMDLVAGLQRLVVVDCIRGTQPPGTIYTIDWRGPGHSHTLTSLHQVTIGDVLDRVALIAEPPITTIIGVEPASLGVSMELSPALGAQLETLCALCLVSISNESSNRLG